MWWLYYPICVTTNSWHLVEMKLTDNLRIGQWPYHFLICQYWLAIGWLWITVSKWLTNCFIENTKDRWCSIDDHFQNWEMTVPGALLMVKAANMFVTHNRKHDMFQSPYLHNQISLMICWQAVKGGNNTDINHIANKSGQTSTMCTGRSTTLRLNNMQHLE